MGRLPGWDAVELAAAALWRRRRLLEHDRWSRARLEGYQARRLAELRRFARDHSPFYRRFHAGLEGAALGELPVLTKATLMAQFDAVVTDPGVRLADLERHVAAITADVRFQGRYWATATSGSSGRRGSSCSTGGSGPISSRRRRAPMTGPADRSMCSAGRASPSSLPRRPGTSRRGSARRSGALGTVAAP
ncbi:MAG: hypothetical protein U0232_03070 [Thermomicrobiales bacterium]